MSDDSLRDDGADEEPNPHVEQIRHSQVSAIVPAEVAAGHFSTGAIVLEGAHEFLIDFLLRMTSPQQVVSRVILPHRVMGQFERALRENIGNYASKFGEPHRPEQLAAATSNQEENVPREPGTDGGGGGQSSVTELYEQLKLPETVLRGTYANAVMIGHTATEFSFDFITTFFPRSSVASRVFMSAGNVPGFLDSVSHSYGQFLKKHSQSNDPPDGNTSE